MVSLPGLGTIMAGQRVGWLQAAISATGFILSSWWAGTFIVAWTRTREFPLDGGPHLLTGVVGVILFVVAWLWAFVTGLAILRAAHGNKPPARPTP